jgi:cytochrome c oxidase assembly protein subunit 11
MHSERVVQANRRLVRWLMLVVVGMFGFGFALVPLYNVFCEITGINGKTGGAVDAQAALTEIVDKDRVVTVEFVSAVNAGLPWEFRPVVKKMKVHPGEMNEALYFARNQSNEAVVGQAIPSVAPGLAAKHFNKVECFCFTQQTLGPREERDMPVRFVIDPELPPEVVTVTLSYTFYKSTAEEQELPASGSDLPPITDHTGHTNHGEQAHL